MSRIRPPFTTSMTGPRTTPPSSLIFSIVPHARSYWARFFERTRRPSLSSFCRTSASTSSPSDTISCASTSWRIESSRAGMTPSDLKPMSSRTSSRSTLTTVPVTMSPSSNSTIVWLIASSKESAAEVVLDDLCAGCRRRRRRRCHARSGRRMHAGASVSRSGRRTSDVDEGSPSSTSVGRARSCSGCGCRSVVGLRLRPSPQLRCVRSNGQLIAALAMRRRGDSDRLGVRPGRAPGDVHLEGDRQRVGVAHRRERELVRLAPARPREPRRAPRRAPAGRSASRGRAASSAASRRTSAILKMSAARPWMPAFIAWRSAAWRTRKLSEASSGR